MNLNKMNRVLGISTLIIVTSLFAISCGETAEANMSKEELLTKLKADKATITKQISELEHELGKDIKESTPVEVIEVNTQTFKRYVDVQGFVKSDRNSMVSPRMGGLVTSVSVSEGQKVSKGQVLASIDDSVQKKQLAEAENSLEFISTLYDRQKRLWEAKAGSEIEYLKAKNDFESMTRRIEIIKEQIDMLKIRAPFSGTVDQIIAKVGETSMPGMSAFRLVSSSGLKVLAELSESYSSNFKKGDMVQVIFPDLDGETLNLKISSVTRSIDSKNRTINVYIDLPENISRINPNMLCIARLNDFTADSVIVVPVNLVQMENEREYVYLASQKGEKILTQKKYVSSGESYMDKIIIREGLIPGDVIISNGALQVSSGDPLEIVK
jgi:membrane fusion protein, multidrug efflux system